MFGMISNGWSAKSRLKRTYFFSLLFCLAQTPGHAENATTPHAVQKASTTKLVGHSSSLKAPLSPSREAVELLESIFERLRSVPQLAMTRSKQTLAYRVYGNNGNIAQGTVDPLLIKPKDLSRLSSQLKKLSDTNIIASAPTGQRYANARSVPMITNSSGIWERAQMPAPMTEPAGTSDSFSAAKTAYAQDKVKTYLGTRSAQIADGQTNDTTVIASQPFIREFAGSSGTSVENAPTTPSVAQSELIPEEKRRDANELAPAKASMARARLNTLAAAPMPQQPALQGATNGTIGPQAAGARWSFAPNVYKLEKSQNSLANLQDVLQGKNVAKQMPRANAEARQIQRALNDAKILGSDKEKELAENSGGLTTISTQQSAENKKPMVGLDVALLPVTKFMGIPQIRLGTNEAEAIAVANKIGVVRKETIKGWTVLSISQSKSKQASLQFFLRAGNLDAIRISDAAFWEGEHGISVGTGLPDVKRQLGEPAFIISNGVSSTAQNYVYPISQVDFQLKRSVDDEVPKVVGILLFAVK